MTQTINQRILDAINTGFKAGAADDDWDATEMQLARELTAQAGMVWEFSSWSHAASLIRGWPTRRVGNSSLLP